MPSFFSPSPSHGAVISSVAFAIRSFTGVSYNTFVPFWGTVLAHLGQARYPTWASTLPHLGTFAARMLPICPQYGRLRLGLNGILLVLVFCDEPRVSVPPRMITHPNLPKGKGQVTLQLITVNHISPHLASKPILPFPKGRNKLLCFVKDFSKSIQPMNISPHLASPVGEGQILCY